LTQKISRRDLKVYRKYKGDESAFKSTATRKELLKLTEDKFASIHSLVNNEIPILTNHASLDHIHHQQTLREKFLAKPRRDKHLLKRIAMRLHIQQDSGYTIGDFFGELLDLSWLSRM
jgi:hypothetical protein